MMFKKRKHKKKRHAGQERRREPRTDDLNQITLEVQDDSTPGLGRGVYYAKTRDASPSGIRVETDVQFPAGTRVLVKFKSPKTRKSIQAQALVKWVEKPAGEPGFQTGLEFVETSVETILDFLEHIYKA